MPDQAQSTLSWVEIETSREAQIETMGRIYRTTGCLPTDPVPRCFWKRAALLYVAENRCQGFFGFGFAGTMRNEQRHCITASVRSGRQRKNVRMEYTAARIGSIVLVCWDKPEDPRMACRYTQAITGMRTGVCPEPQIAATQWRAATQRVRDNLVSALQRRAANIMAEMLPPGSLAASYRQWQAATREFGPQWNTYIDMERCDEP